MDKAVERLIDLAGSSHKYQYILFALTLLIGYGIGFGSITIPFLQAYPSVDYTDASEVRHFNVTLTSEICDLAHDIKVVHSPVSSMLADFNIECDKTAKALFNFFYSLGSVFTALFTSLLAQSCGRKTIIVTSAICFAAGLIASGIDFSYSWVLLCWAFYGIFDSALTTSFQVLVFEVLKPSWRTFYGAAYAWMFVIAAYILIFQFQMQLDWRAIFFIHGLIVIVSAGLSYYLIIESPRYYLKEGNFAQFKKQLLEIAKVNGREKEFEQRAEDEEGLVQSKQLEEDLQIVLTELDKIHPEENSAWEFSKVFQNRKTTIDFLLVSYFWCFAIFGYTILGLNIKNLAGDEYVNGYLMYVAEFFSYIIVFFMMDVEIFKRKGTYLIFSALSFVLTFATFFVDKNSHECAWINIFNRFCLNSIWTTISIINCEIFPSYIRVTASSWSLLLSRVASLSTSFVLEYFENYVSLILILMNTLNIALGFFIDDMKDKELVDLESKRNITFKV